MDKNDLIKITIPGAFIDKRDRQGYFTVDNTSFCHITVLCPV